MVGPFYTKFLTSQKQAIPKPFYPFWISSKIAKDIFDILWTKGGNPEELVESLGLAQLTDETQLDSIVEKIIETNPDQVKKVKENPKLKSWFIGQAMKETKGKANPKILSGIVEKLLR